MGELSRNDLVQWVNDLLQLNYTKIEQLGTGAAYCQIMDAIKGDVRLDKVKFDSKQEFEYLANYKVLQEAFTKHKVDKAIPVDKLIRCKMQDNLEFTQWLYKYYQQFNSGAAYDPLSRRKAGPLPASSSAAAPASRTTRSAIAPRAAPASAAPRAAPTTTARSTLASTRASSAVAPRTTTAAPRTSVTSSTSMTSSRGTAASSAVMLEKQVTDLKLTLESLEKERDFYFGKLRDIEVLVQAQTTAGDAQLAVPALLKEIERILYSTEEGFEIPEVAADQAPAEAAAVEQEPEPEQDEF